MTDTPTSRRSFIAAAASVAAVPLVGKAQPANRSAPIVAGRRKLGKLEVSSIGLGAQNMSRTYQTIIPTRTEMHQILRTAFDSGVTFFDAAEAYGPHEVERILGEGVAPFRNQVAITSKFGWNIDHQTGKRLPGLNSRPESKALFSVERHRSAGDAILAAAELYLHARRGSCRIPND